MSGVSDDRKRHARSGDDERYKWVENEFCGKHSTFFPRRFDQIAFAGSKIAKPLKKTPHLKKIVANPRTPKGLFTASVNVFLAAQDGVHFALGIRQQDRVGSPYTHFFKLTAPTVHVHLKSLPVAFARVNMFKSAVVSDCLMMTGKFAGLQGARWLVCRDAGLTEYHHGGTAGNGPSFSIYLLHRQRPTKSTLRFSCGSFNF